MGADVARVGPGEISASHEKGFTRFEGSQHVVAGHDISLDGSTANVRANLIAMHMWQGSLGSVPVRLDVAERGHADG